MKTTRIALLTAAGALALLGAGAPALAGAAPAAASVAVTSDVGEDAASDAGPTTLDVSGSGFQVVQGGFGGIYVAFGWVSGEAWGPSAGGVSGTDYVYIADGMTADSNTGAMRFLSFPGSSTGGEAQGVMNDDGTWSTTLEVSGPVLEFSDAAGNAREVDCRVETCGVLTFGAHGVKNANNETFTPVSFVASGAEPSVTPSAEPSASPSESEAASPEPAPEASPSDAVTGATDAAGEEPSAAPAESGGNSATPWLIAGGVILLGVLAAVAGFASKKRGDGAGGGGAPGGGAAG